VFACQSCLLLAKKYKTGISGVEKALLRNSAASVALRALYKATSADVRIFTFEMG
jgi:hypothetical protein